MAINYRVQADVIDIRTDTPQAVDIFLLEAAKAAGISKVLTDDGDFSGVPGIQMFTKNQRVLTAAQTQGKIIVR